MNSKFPRIFFRSIYRVIKKLIELVFLSFSSRTMRDVVSTSDSGMKLIGRKVDVENYSDIKSLSINLNKIISHVRSTENEVINIIDVGANLGFYSLAFAINENTIILAYEPFKESFEYLKSNVSNNNFNNIKSINVGLSNENEKLFLGPPKYKKLPTRVLKYFDRYSLGSRTIYTDRKANNDRDLSQFYIGDEEVNIRNLNRVDIIKIDVEGSEIKVLSGLMKTINKYLPAIMIEINNNYDTKEIFSFLVKMGYSQFLDFSLLNDSDVSSQLIDIGLLEQSLDSEKIALDLVFF